MDRSAPPPVDVGDVIAGKYRIERHLGRGGMATVVAATHLHLDQLVALKFMHGHLAQNVAMTERFLREVRAMVRLRSEHIARILDADTTGSGVPFMVLEYLEGEDLFNAVRKRGPFSPADAAGHLLQACVGVAEAHAHGIIHRDLKPHNLFLSRGPDGRPLVKVLDFGLAKASWMSGRQTAAGVMIGSPAFMSPEQLESARDVDERTDVWALGAILYFLVSGNPPFRGRRAAEIAVQIAEHGPAPLDESDTPAWTRDVVTTCLRADRSERYAGVAGLAAALADHAPGGDATAARIDAILRAGPERGAAGDGRDGDDRDTEVVAHPGQTEGATRDAPARAAFAAGETLPMESDEPASGEEHAPTRPLRQRAGGAAAELSTTIKRAPGTGDWNDVAPTVPVRPKSAPPRAGAKEPIAETPALVAEPLDARLRPAAPSGPRSSLLLPAAIGALVAIATALLVAALFGR